MVKKTNTPNRKRGRGAILVIASLLIGSAALRVGANAENVLGQVGVSGNAENANRQATLTVEEFPDKEALQRMLDLFSEREEKIKQQELEILKKSRILEVSNRKLEERLAELVQAEERLRNTLALASTAAEDDLSKLTAVYENMKPNVAAALFEEMDPQFAAGFLGRMRPDAAAAVMAGMTPEKAYSVSAILAGRNANVPKD